MSSYLEELFSLKGRVAVVTGAARGNGRALAEALGRAGASVVLADLLADVEKTAADLAGEGAETMPFIGDITKAEDRERLQALLTERFGTVDILVNNAGVTFSHPPLEYPDDHWEKTYQVNLLAPFKLSTICGAMMKTAGRGSIINITSLNAELAFPDNPAYVAFKGALRQLTKSLALDLGQFGIRANNIGPGYFHTQMTTGSYNDPVRNAARAARTILGRWGQPQDLAGLVIFLASDASSYVTGQDIYIDGGWMIKGL